MRAYFELISLGNGKKFEDAEQANEILMFIRLN